MPDLYLHIGTPKTGTSAIQSLLRNNTDVLKEQNCIFPSFQEWPATMPGSIRNAHWLTKKYYQSDVAEHCLEIIADYAKTYSKIILSDESLWYTATWNNDILNFICDRFGQMGLNIKVIVYLRPQADLLYSLWAQFVKKHQFKNGLPPVSDTFDEYCKNLSPNQKKRRLDYREGLERMEKFFGRENIFVRVYDTQKAQADSRYYPNDFMKIVGISTENIQYPKKLVNTSLKDRYLETKRLLNSVNTEEKDIYYLYHVLQDIQMEEKDTIPKHPRPYFSPAAKNKMMEEYREDNRWIAEHFLGLPSGTDLFPQFKENEDDKEVNNTFTTEEILHVIHQLIDRLHEKQLAQEEDLHSIQKYVKDLKKQNQKIQNQQNQKNQQTFFNRVKKKIKRMLHRS